MNKGDLRVCIKNHRAGPVIITLLALLLLIFFLAIFYLGRYRDKYREPGNAKDAVAGILQNMTLEEKVGQVITAYFTGPGFGSALAGQLRDLPLGGVILFSGAGNIESPSQVAGLVEQIQRAALDRGMPPLFIAIDQEGGAVARLTEGVTLFPGNMALGAAGSADLAGLSAAVTARELRILGINFNFAPVVDVNSNPANPVIGVRSFSSNPQDVARLGRAMVAPYRREGVIAAAKHFPGHGDTAIDSHYGLPLVPHDLSRLEELELIPFQAMVDAGVPAVMLAHILAPGLTGTDGLPASLSPQAVRYLREQMGFEGLVVTDSLSMGAISNNWGLEEASVKAFQAGADLILFGPWAGVEPGDCYRIFNALLEAVQAGAITPERLDQSVRRILRTKMDYGLMEDPLPHRENLSQLALPESLELARRIARESITLVRDSASVIPLSSRAKIPLIWPAELEGSLAPLLEDCPFLQPHLLSLQAPDTDISEVLDSLRGSPLVLAGTYNLGSYPAWAGLLNDLAAETELVLLALASPYDIMAVPSAGAYLCSYSSSSASMQALAGVLNGTLLPGGRLPVELPGLEQPAPSE